MSENKIGYFDIKPPEVPPEINMRDPEFKKLTSAEKLNNSEYRRVIYRAFPNEPICACVIDPQVDGMPSVRECPGRCMNRSRRAENNTSGNPRGPGHDNGRRCPLNEVRMRGGGCEDLYRMWEDLDTSRIPRTRNSIDWNNSRGSNYYYTSRADNFHSENSGNPRNSSKCRTDPQGCGEGPCIGADCFLRSLRETQEFVDSLGRVPGLAGLGLQDPSESPYFRTRELPSEDIERTLPDSKCKKRSNKGHNQQKHQKTDAPMITNTKPFTLPSSGKREHQGSLVSSLQPFTYNFEKSEQVPDEGVGPCGESSCRSRRKIKEKTSSSHEIVKDKNKNKNKEKKSSRGRRNRKGFPVHGGQDLRPSRRIKYVYLAGDTYPGGTFGHKNCNDPRKRVPANMGWLWNDYHGLGRLKPRVGWHPGALSRTMKEIIRETRAGALEDARSRSAHSRNRKNRSQTSMKKSQSRKLEEEQEEPPPTLHILRRDGTYYVTMYPIKQEKMEVPQLEEPMKPLQFKIVKEKDESESESSTASDIEIEFSPPAAVNRYRKKPDVVHVDVQVKQQEILEAFKPVGEKKKEKKGKKGKK